MRGIKLYAMFAAMFMAGAFLASPELRVYAANTVGSADIINNSIQSLDVKDGEVKTLDIANNAVTEAKIKDGEVKAADIATDAVGSAEIAGVSKLLFAKCLLTDEEGGKAVNPGKGLGKLCNIAGVTTADQAIGNLNWGNSCFAVTQVLPQVGGVAMVIQNTCTTIQTPSDGSFISLIVYHK
jgi:uncharacterized membrane protein